MAFLDRILEFAHVQDVITGISALFSMEDFAETAFSLRQTDIAGFYNQVEHDRILLAIQFAVFTFASQCEQGLDMLFVWNGFFVFSKDLGEKRRNNI